METSITFSNFNRLQRNAHTYERYQNITMNLSKIKVRALGLCSGGLDSILSALVLRNQGIEVEWITFETPFFSSEKARAAARKTGIPLTVEKITQIYLKMLKNPPCGYGQHMNPCLDCHTLMFRQAGALMKKKMVDFLFSGEVLGQRPMSQTKPSLRYVEKHSEYDGYILRPLSAKKLPVSIPEKEGLVNRELLLDISGRSRKPQIKLVKEFGISDYPSPAGGCLLTDKCYSKRLKDLFEHQDSYSEKELYLLKYGRHFRLNEKSKIIVGRTKEDNDNIIKNYNPSENILIKVDDYPGPTVLLTQGSSKSIIFLAASICTGYSKAPNTEPVTVSVETGQSSETVQVIGVAPAEIRHFMI